MALYKNNNAASAIHSVEFTPMSDGNFTFFAINAPAGDAALQKQKTDEIKTWLTSKALGQEIVAETTVNGQPMLVTHGDKIKEEMLKTLEARGDKMEIQHHKKAFNWWALRGGLSVVGQTLHLASAILGVEKLGKDHALLNPQNAHFNPKLKAGMYVRKAFAPDIGIFAALNQTANLANIIYGGQTENGENRLQAVKDDINQTIGDQGTLLDTSEKRAALRKETPTPLTTMDRVDRFAKAYSVRFFEIGLRVLGTTALIVPWKKASLSKGLGELQKGKFFDAWKAVKNPDSNYFRAGLAYMTGKIMSFAAKVPDPYDDKPHTTLDTIREKYLFKAGTLVEAYAGGTMAYNAFTNKKWGIKDSKRPDIKPHMDYLSGVGGSLFVAGFGARFFAPYGEKHVDMEEVYAHAADTLAKTPPDKLPQLMAETAATLKEHFKDKQMEFGEIYTKMMTDMYRYHHVALDNLGTEPGERLAKLNAEAQAPAAQPEPPAAEAKFTLANPSRRPADMVAAPAGATYTEKTVKSMETSTVTQVGP